MDKQYLENKAKEEGFNSIEDYVRANLHYLPPKKQELFFNLTGYKLPDSYKKDYYGGEESGKG